MECGSGCQTSRVSGGSRSGPPPPVCFVLLRQDPEDRCRGHCYPRHARTVARQPSDRALCWGHLRLRACVVRWKSWRSATRGWAIREGQDASDGLCRQTTRHRAYLSPERAQMTLAVCGYRRHVLQPLRCCCYRGDWKRPSASVLPGYRPRTGRHQRQDQSR